jgi:hypothetical protein
MIIPPEVYHHEHFQMPHYSRAIEKLKRHKSAGIDQIPAELIKAGGRTTGSKIHKLINSIWNKGELPEE